MLEVQSIRKKAADSLRLLTAIQVGDHLAPVRVLKRVAKEVADRLAPGDARAKPDSERTLSEPRAPAPAARTAPVEAQSPLEVDAGELRSRLDAGEALVVVDVREPMETARGVIPGARLIPLGTLLERIGEIRDEGKAVVVYCAHGQRSLHAALQLRDRGVGRTQSLRGGIEAWLANGGEIRA
jgi:adenylyltransferase/sulfurtransferase